MKAPSFEELRRTVVDQRSNARFKRDFDFILSRHRDETETKRRMLNRIRYDVALLHAVRNDVRNTDLLFQALVLLRVVSFVFCIFASCSFSLLLSGCNLALVGRSLEARGWALR